MHDTLQKLRKSFMRNGEKKHEEYSFTVNVTFLGALASLRSAR